MRDVIVAGAGGGGAVIAKELAAVGLDVLLLEAGPRFADPERDWSHFESDANNPASGYFRFGPADRSRPPWVRELAQSSLFVQLSGVGGTTNHYYIRAELRDSFSGSCGCAIRREVFRRKSSGRAWPWFC